VGWDFSVSSGVQTPDEMPRSGNKVMSKEQSGLRISALINSFGLNIMDKE
jgi:hypothetical protein